MFFFLSKILSFLLTPIIWIFILLLLSLLWRNKKKRKTFLVLAFCTFYLFSNSFLLDEVCRWWEIPAVADEAVKEADAAIILGGMLTYDEKLDRVQFSYGSDRLLQAIRLYKKGAIKKLFFTGGSGSIVYKHHRESPLVRQYLLTLGIPEEDIIIESESKNTYENAVFSKNILEEKIPREKYLLITSASHMRRAVACFTKQGIAVIPYSADRLSGPRKFTLDHLLIPDAETLFIWNRLIHEWLGYFIYAIAGYL
jgi:uncharacterized SAM-binding protein YcdF (DUF218 family)